MRAVIYCRISDDRTGQAAGVKRQEADARELCKRRGWDVVEVVVDNDVSASRYTRKVRPGYARIVEMIAAGEVDVIAAYHVDRLYRRPVELEDLIDLAESVLIATCEGEFRLDTSDGRAMARVIAAMAAKSSDDASRRIKRKHLELAEAGLPIGGRFRPFGFDDDLVTHRPDEAARIREAARRVVAGESLGSILRSWSDVKTVTGARWSTRSLRQVLENPRVAGLRALGGRVVGEAVWDPILERSEWEQVCRALAARKMAGGSNDAPRSYLLAGLIVCPCGAKMTAHPLTVKGRTYRRYFCLKSRGGCNRNGISADRSEAFVVAAVLAEIAKGGPLADGGTIDTGDDTRPALAQAEADLDGLAQDLADGLIGRAAYGAASLALEQRITRLRRALVSEARSADTAEIAGSADPAAAFDRQPFDRKRVILLHHLERVEVAYNAGRSGFSSERLVPVWR